MPLPAGDVGEAGKPRPGLGEMGLVNISPAAPSDGHFAGRVHQTALLVHNMPSDKKIK